MSRPRRHLRAVPDEPDSRLFDGTEQRVERVPSAPLARSEAPIGLLRIDFGQLEHLAAAVKADAAPSALVTAITEPAHFTGRIRRLHREWGLPWFADSYFYKTQLPGYRSTSRLQGLDYAPGPDAGPFSLRQLGQPKFLRRLARDVVAAQLEIGASGVMTGSLFVEDGADKRLALTRDLIRTGLGASAESLFRVAPLMLRMSNFESLESQRLLVRGFAGLRPDAVQLFLDGVGEDASEERLVAAIRLAMLFKAGGHRVILGRAGDLRHLFLAFGVDGIEYGLGRFFRFELRDYAGKSGAGPTPSPRFESAELVGSLPAKSAQLALGLELIEDADCRCPACTKNDLDERLRRSAEHDAHLVHSQLDALSGVEVGTRLNRLDGALASATYGWAELERAGGMAGGAKRAERWRRAVETAREQHLDDEERLREVLAG